MNTDGAPQVERKTPLSASLWISRQAPRVKRLTQAARMSVAALAKSLGVNSHAVCKKLEIAGVLHRVIKSKRTASGPNYSTVYQPTEYGLREGFAVPTQYKGDRMVFLVTPAGQQLVSGGKPREHQATPAAAKELHARAPWLTQRSLAEKLGVSQRTVSRWLDQEPLQAA